MKYTPSIALSIALFQGSVLLYLIQIYRGEFLYLLVFWGT
jgi:hypothetical protein